MITHKLKSIKARNILYIASFTAIASLAEGASEAEKDPSFYNIPAPMASREAAKANPSPQVPSGSEKTELKTEDPQEMGNPTASEEKKSKGRFQNLKDRLQTTKEDIQNRIDNSKTAQRGMRQLEKASTTAEKRLNEAQQSKTGQAIGKKFGVANTETLKERGDKLDKKLCRLEVADLMDEEQRLMNKSKRSIALSSFYNIAKSELEEELEECKSKIDCFMIKRKMTQYGEKSKKYQEVGKKESDNGKEAIRKATEMEKNCPRNVTQQ